MYNTGPMAEVISTDACVSVLGETITFLNVHSEFSCDRLALDAECGYPKLDLELIARRSAGIILPQPMFSEAQVIVTCSGYLPEQTAKRPPASNAVKALLAVTLELPADILGLRAVMLDSPQVTAPQLEIDCRVDARNIDGLAKYLDDEEISTWRDKTGAPYVKSGFQNWCDLPIFVKLNLQATI